jgi:4-hydroxy-3-methylbut-2-enyl diphosphate reductase
LTSKLNIVVKKVYIAEPRGFCAGVEMAIKALSFLVRACEPPVYCYHEIVHNQTVVDRFKAQGVIFVDSIDEVPEGATVMLSAHGSAPQVVEDSATLDRLSVNAVCPLVTKVHHEAKTRAKKGFQILYVGHEGHDEALGTMAVAPENIHLVTDKQSLDDVVNNIDDAPVALLAQTTLAISEWKKIEDQARNQFPEMWTATRNDLCFATTNRQSALIELSKLANVIIIIGSANSSNTLALEKVARETGCTRVYRIDSADQVGSLGLLDDDIVGITAGASAPEDIVQSVVDACNSREAVEPLSVIDEDEYFPPPSQLREFAIDMNYALEKIFNARRKEQNQIAGTRNSEELRSVFAHDRSVSASDALINA